MKKRFVLFALFLLGASVVFGQVPKTFSYQGVLTDAAGNAVADGSYTMIFRLYDAAQGGTQLWEEKQAVVVTDGLFHVILGKAVPLELPFDGPYWLEIELSEGGLLQPRIELTASAYSLRAASVADSAITSSSIAGGTVVRSINSLTDRVRLLAGDNVSITESDTALVISATGGDSGGDITAVLAGEGLVGGGESGEVTLSLSDGGVTTAKLAAGAVTAEKIAAGQVMKSLNGLRDEVVLSATGGATVTTRNDTVFINAGGGSVAGWSLTGNAGTTPGTHFLGTTDNRALELHVNSQRALRLEPTSGTPNLIGGFSGNSVAAGVTAGVVGATIAGGGDSGVDKNRVTDHYGTVGGV